MAVASTLLGGKFDLNEIRVVFLLPAGFEWVATQWGIWQAGGICVPVSSSATELELEHVLIDSGVTVAITCPESGSRLKSICDKLRIGVILSEEITFVSAARDLPSIDPSRRAMILYTSGTTSRPKGVVTTQANIEAQIRSLMTAWEWTKEDSIPYVPAAASYPWNHQRFVMRTLVGSDSRLFFVIRYVEDPCPVCGQEVLIIHGSADNLCEADSGS